MKPITGTAVPESLVIFSVSLYTYIYIYIYGGGGCVVFCLSGLGVFFCAGSLAASGIGKFDFLPRRHASNIASTTSVGECSRGD